MPTDELPRHARALIAYVEAREDLSIDQMRRALLAVAREQYADRPTSDVAFDCDDRWLRVVVLAARVAQGLSPFHPADVITMPGWRRPRSAPRASGIFSP